MTNLLELIKNNPTLPVYAWVNHEVCGGDDYTYWLGEMYNATKTKVVGYETYGEDRMFEYDDKNLIFEYLCDQEEYEDTPDEEIWAMVEALPWKECILVWVGTPDSL